MTTKALAAALALLALAAAGAAATGPARPEATGSARAFAVKVIVPAQAGGAAGEVVAPPANADALDVFAYPADGSVVRTGAISTSVAVRPVDGASAQAVADVLELSLFGGELTAASVAARARADAKPESSAADGNGSALTGLVVLGRPVTPAPNLQVALGDWGYAVLLEQAVVEDGGEQAMSANASSTALHVHLTQAHGGLPAGSEIVVGFAEAAAQAPAAAPPAPTTTTTAAPSPPKGKPAGPGAKGGRKRALPKPPEPERIPGIPGTMPRRSPPDVLPQLTAGGYVFPVYGPSSFTDTFGAPRAQVGWHHGEDIFAPLGAPVLAVADGTVFSVGWNDIGGYRLWLRDRQGNQFYYAHLSAFSPLATNGREVRGGDVLGFVGNTGDAQGTPYHLHFEIHPVAMLGLGYDGVVNAHEYLVAWQRLVDVSFGLGRGWAPPTPPNARAPRPGAILLHASDIAGASGLEPASLERALAAPVSAEGDGALIRSSDADVRRAAGG